LFGVLLFAPIAAVAASGWTDYAPIVELTPTVHQRFLVKLKVSNNPSGCKNKDTFYQLYAAPGADLMYRTLLEAMTSGKKVRVYVTGICGLNGYSEISAMTIVP
jgi:hypothetical protein